MNKDMNKRPFSSRKRALVGFAVVCVVLLAALGLGSDYMLRYALRPSMEHSHDLSWRFHNIIDENPQLRPWADSLQRHQALRDTFVTMPTGERHHATYILAPRPTDRVALLVHGYEDNGMGMMHIASIYHHMGFNLLLPDLHAHGRSEGEAVQMGWLDRLDVMRWMEVANSRFGRDGSSRMVLHGVSMGAATVMCVSGETLPSYVKCFVEDCGYTSAWDEFEGELHDRFGLPAFPLLHACSALCRVRYGWSFDEASPLRQVARCHKPMLFIHGERDTFVPFSMLARLYAAKPQPKAQWVSTGSIHARSFHDHPVAYAAHVRAFVGQYISLGDSLK